MKAPPVAGSVVSLKRSTEKAPVIRVAPGPRDGVKTEMGQGDQHHGLVRCLNDGPVGVAERLFRLLSRASTGDFTLLGGSSIHDSGGGGYRKVGLGEKLRCAPASGFVVSDSRVGARAERLDVAEPSAEFLLLAGSFCLRQRNLFGWRARYRPVDQRYKLGFYGLPANRTDRVGDQSRGSADGARLS